LKDFALRQKKQREEEMAKLDSPVSISSPIDGMDVVVDANNGGDEREKEDEQEAVIKKGDDHSMSRDRGIIGGPFVDSPGPTPVTPHHPTLTPSPQVLPTFHHSLRLSRTA
jgi:hypothetical protein